MPLSPEQARALCLGAIDVLVELHSVDADAAGLTDLGKGAGYVRRQVEGWSVRYRNARTDDVPDYEDVMAWLAEHQPDDVATCVIHNDYKLDNLVLVPRRRDPRGRRPGLGDGHPRRPADGPRPARWPTGSRPTTTTAGR